VQFGSDTVTVGVGFSGAEALAQVSDFLAAGTAAANLGTATGCGHGLISCSSGFPMRFAHEKMTIHHIKSAVVAEWRGLVWFRERGLSNTEKTIHN
jgi:hypothetical protein